MILVPVRTGSLRAAGIKWESGARAAVRPGKGRAVENRNNDHGKQMLRKLEEAIKGSSLFG